MALQNQLALDMLLLKEQGNCGILNLNPFTMQHYQLKKPEPKWNKSLIKYQSSSNHSKPKVGVVVEVHILNLVTYMSIMMIGLMIATAVTFVTVGITIVHCIIAFVIFLLLCLFSSDFSTNTSPRWTTCEMRKRSQEDTVWATGQCKRLKDHNCLKHCQGHRSDLP